MHTGLKFLEPLVGEWTLEAGAPGGEPWPGGGRVTFEWIDGGAFLRQSWSIELPEAPDGVAIFGSDASSGRCFQLYTDERDVHRVYEVSLDDGVWRMWREADDPFPQRFIGNFEDRGNTIRGRWEKAPEGDWEIDFNFTYRRLPVPGGSA